MDRKNSNERNKRKGINERNENKSCIVIGDYSNSIIYQTKTVFVLMFFSAFALNLPRPIAILMIDFEGGGDTLPTPQYRSCASH